MAIDASALESVRPYVAETRVAPHLRHLILAATARTPDPEDLDAAVREARAAGETWDLISMALGLPPEQARQRHGSREGIATVGARQDSAV
jgi:hypothetical protein